MAHDSFPRGASFGRHDDPRRTGTFDADWIASNGTRAQKRQARRQLKRMAASGNREVLAALAAIEGGNR